MTEQRYDLNGTAPAVFDPTIPPGGWVCAAPELGLPGGICGMPVETEPCPIHNPDWQEEREAAEETPVTETDQPDPDRERVFDELVALGQELSPPAAPREAP